MSEQVTFVPVVRKPRRPVKKYELFVALASGTGFGEVTVYATSEADARKQARTIKQVGEIISVTPKPMPPAARCKQCNEVKPEHDPQCPVAIFRSRFPSK